MTYSSVVSVAVSTTRRVALCALLGLCLLAGLLPQAGAVSAPATFTVTRTSDTGPGSLRSAIAQAAAVGGTVNFQIPASDPGVSSGTATITLSLGPLVVPSSLSIVGPNMPSGAIVVSGGTGANQSRIFSVTGGMVAFSNLTIQNGNALPSGNGNINFPEPDGGGGILNTASLTLTNCVVTGNTSGANAADGASGGGIKNSGAGANLTLNDCSVDNNTADFGGSGGGVANSGTLTANGTGSISGNASGGNGGGLLNTGTATLNGVFLNVNTAATQGSAPDTGGGGAHNSGTLTLNNCFVEANFTYNNGGGLFNNGMVTLNGISLDRNSSYGGEGGGMTNLGTARITNCLVVSNLDNAVGGLYNGGTLTLINSTFSGNTIVGFSDSPVPSALGLYSGPATLLNDIFYFDAKDPDSNLSSTEIVAAPGTAGPTVTYSDVQGGYPGTGNLNADPLFVRNPQIINIYTDFVSADPGDEHLLIGSPAGHTGTNGSGVPLTDIEGTPRPTPPARPSMGSYELPGGGGFIAQGGFTVTGTQGQSTGSQVVARFLRGTLSANGFTATVTLGDGSVIPGIIAADPVAPGVLQVTVSHTYPSSGTFPVTVVISGPGGTPTATVMSAANIQPFLASLTFPSPVPGGTVVTATVTLSGLALTDTVVGTGSSDPSIVRINRGIIIPAGSSSAAFAINTFRSHVTKTVTITATLGQVALTKNLTITGR